MQSTLPDYGKAGDKVSDWMAFSASHEPLAVDFLKLWNRYIHEVDDVIDENRWDAENLLKVLLLACEVFSHPFYVKYRSELQMPAILATNQYADSVKWERSQEIWKRQWAAPMGQAGSQLVFAVAMLSGGWEHLRKISSPLLAVCYVHRLDKYGAEGEKLIK